MEPFTDKQREELMSILSKYPYKFYIFGSRSRGTHRKYSDLDLCYKGNMNRLEKAYLEMDFEDSDLPFRVEVSSWEKFSNDFKKGIKHDLKALT